MALVPAILPFVALMLSWCLVHDHRGRLGVERLSWRGTFVVALLVVEAIVVLLTELLSIGRHLTSGITACAWLVVIAGLVVTLVTTVGADALAGRVRSITGVSAWFRRQPRSVIAALAVLAVVFGVLVSIGWIYVPNNGDSLIEHLPRVAHWQQESSIAHFATHETGQIEFAPLHQYNMLHLHLLGGTDRLDGYVQLLGFLVCVAAAAEITRLLGATRPVQAGAAVLCATIPSAVLQATSTQNIVFAAAVGAGVFVVLFAQCGPPTGARRTPPAVLLGVGVGEAFLAKGIVLPLLGPALVLVVGRIAFEQRRSWRKIARVAAGPAVVAAVCSLAIAGPFLKRNYDVFGSFAGPISDSHVNDAFSPRAQTGNVIRSVALHFRIGDAADGSVDGLLQRIALNGLEAVDGMVGAPDHDPRFVFGGPYDPFATGDYRLLQRVEIAGADAWHVLLVIVCGCALVVSARRCRSDTMAVTLAVGLALGFVLFSATTKWYLSLARYHVVTLVLWCPIIAIALARRRLLAIAVVLLGLAVLPQLLDNANRSILHRRTESGLAAYIAFSDDQDFFVGPSDHEAVRDALVQSGCTRIGIANWVVLEYAIWRGLDLAGWEGEIQHVFVQNESAALAPSDFEPCALVRETLDRAPHEQIPGWRDVPYGDLTVSFPVADDAARPGSG